MNRYCLALDLVDDERSIAEYRRYHEKIWPEIRSSILEAGVTEMEIYLVGNRMFMIMEVDDTFTFEAKRQADLANPKVQEWERLMWSFQQALPQARPGEKWMLMERVFRLSEQ